MQKGSLIQWGFKPWLNQVKPPTDASDFKGNLIKTTKHLLTFLLYFVIQDWNHHKKRDCTEIIPNIIHEDDRLFCIYYH